MLDRSMQLKNKNNMYKCYLCNRELIDKKTYEQSKENFKEKPAINHKEHIIQNSLHGKLKLENILCSDCGGILSTQIDTQFCSLFNLITVQLKNILVSKDHGNSNKSKTIKGYLYKDISLTEKIDVDYKDKRVSPKKPYYEIDNENKIIKVFANKKRANHFKKQIQNELNKERIDIRNYKIEIDTNIESRGILGLHFIEGIDDFNSKFKKGFSKIAIGFAISKGINREELTNVLKINEDKSAEITYSNKLFPFFPLSVFDVFYEENRLAVELNYPTHEIILFSQKYSDNTKKLFCYISLFSTFQHYVLLNVNYKGPDIYETYYQTILKQDIPDIDIRKIRPKYLSVIVNEFGIDTSEYKGKTVTDYITYIEKEFKKLKPNYQLNLFGELKKSASILTDRLLPAIVNHTNQTELHNLPDDDIVKRFDEINDRLKIALLSELQLINNDDFSLYKRGFLEDNGYNQLERLSYPDELVSETKRSKDIFDAYGHMKFQQLTEFIELNKEKIA